MASKRKQVRVDPFSEGSLAQIYKLYFGRLIFFKPTDTPIADWLEELFDVKHREITRYRANHEFTLPGLQYIAPTVKIQGVGYRRIRQDQELWVRTDSRAPDAVDVEVFAGQGEADTVYALTRAEWDWVSRFCTNVEEEEHA